MATELEEEIGPEIVQRNGRGVPSIRESSSQADTADLQAAKKQQLLELLASLLRRGRITPEEIAGSVGRSLPPGPLEQLEAARMRLSDLQADLRLERARNAFLEGETTKLESALAREHELLKEGVYQIATLERQLQEAQETTTKLVFASRDSLRTLQRVGTRLNDGDLEPHALDPLVRDLCQMAKAVLDLHSVAHGKDATPAADLENR